MTPFVTSATHFLSYIIVLLDILAVGLFIILITPLRKRGKTKRIAEFFGERAFFLSFLVALGATAGSVFYSDIAGLQPCLLCWWQRIFLFPQTILLLTTFFKKNAGVRLYAIIFSSLGVLVSTYHTFLQFGVQSLFPCSVSGVSCEHVYFLEYGYVTIPTMALTTFALILLFMLAPNPRGKEVNEI
jgi:disulfide bond formation protein DsbB